MSILTKTFEVLTKLNDLTNAESPLIYAVKQKFPDAEVYIDNCNGVVITIDEINFVFVDEAFESATNPSDPTEKEEEILEVLNA